MVASSCSSEPESGVFQRSEVGNSGFLARHNREIFAEGRSFSGNERDKLWLNRGDGTFFDISDLSGCDSGNDGRAAIACDFDDDGDVDLFVHELQRERHALYRNELGTLYGGFLKVRLRGTTGNPEAVGATVTVTTEDGTSSLPFSRGSGYLTCQPPELVFGLGPDATEAQVRVRWPGGAVDEYTLAANSRTVLIEGGESEAFARQSVRLPDPLPPGLVLHEGDVVPTLNLIGANGDAAALDPVALAEGKPLYLNLWASYCGPCVAELPLLESKHAGGEVRVVTVSMDAPADQDTARALLEKNGATFANFYLGEDGATSIDALLDLERLPIPTTLVLDAEGRITEVIRGPITE